MYAEATKFPPGEIRDVANDLFNEISKGKALTMKDVMTLWEVRPTDEASAERAKRARKKLGVPRRAGRPKKTGQE